MQSICIKISTGFLLDPIPILKAIAAIIFLSTHIFMQSESNAIFQANMYSESLICVSQSHYIKEG